MTNRRATAIVSKRLYRNFTLHTRCISQIETCLQLCSLYVHCLLQGSEAFWVSPAGDLSRPHTHTHLLSLIWSLNDLTVSGLFKLSACLLLLGLNPTTQERFRVLLHQTTHESRRYINIGYTHKHRDFPDATTTTHTHTHTVARAHTHALRQTARQTSGFARHDEATTKLPTSPLFHRGNPAFPSNIQLPQSPTATSRQF